MACYWQLFINEHSQYMQYISFVVAFIQKASDSLRNVSGSTQARARAWNNARWSTWGLHPPVKLESRHKTFIVLVRRKTQQQ